MHPERFTVQPMSLLFALVAGALGWSLSEYTLHRFVGHGRTRRREGLWFLGPQAVAVTLDIAETRHFRGDNPNEIRCEKAGTALPRILSLVKPEIAKAGLEWIRRITDPTGTKSLKLARRPSKFVTPEDARLTAGDGASNEVMIASIHELRKEMQSAARRDDPWS